MSKEANSPCLRLTLSIDLAYCMSKLCRMVGASSLEMEHGTEDRTEKELRRSKGGNGKLIQCFGRFTIKLNKIHTNEKTTNEVHLKIGGK